MRYLSTSQYEITYNFYMKNYCYILKELRLAQDMTQAEIAAVLSVKQNTYAQYETGQRQISIDVLIKLAEYYDVPTDYILGLTDIDTPYRKI